MEHLSFGFDSEAAGSIFLDTNNNGRRSNRRSSIFIRLKQIQMSYSSPNDAITVPPDSNGISRSPPNLVVDALVGFQTQLGNVSAATDRIRIRFRAPANVPAHVTVRRTAASYNFVLTLLMLSKTRKSSQCTPVQHRKCTVAIGGSERDLTHHHAVSRGSSSLRLFKIKRRISERGALFGYVPALREPMPSSSIAYIAALHFSYSDSQIAPEV